MIVAEARPSLRRGVLLRYDRVRERHVLMYPEGVLVLNETAAEVLRQCDGTATVAEIGAALSGRYQGFRDGDVAEVLRRLARRGMIEVSTD
ncbi:MAG TPA: pyrroloquinoline quinone biosynthesis peptide chaperone PqqD [Pseudonocardiaceae bacterium]|nr:pyrroloquinoline quinone biosynthesis peptide chaperone PqqD [Pseudonocardiaceae bacterium]